MKLVLVAIFFLIACCQSDSILGKRKRMETNQEQIEEYRSYVIDKIRDKVFEATGSRPSRNIPRASIEIKNWPSSVLSLNPDEWTTDDAITLVLKIDEVEISASHEKNSVTLSEAKEFHDRLRDALFSIKYATNKHIRWSKLRERIPELTLTSTFYSQWRRTDLEVLQKLVLDAFVPDERSRLILEALNDNDGEFNVERAVTSSSLSNDLRKYVMDQLVDIYHRDTGDINSKRVRWSTIHVSGWPVNVPTLRKSTWTDGHIRSIYNNLKRIKMYPVREPEIGEGNKDNTELRTMLLEQLRPLGYVRGKSIDWMSIRQECPSIVLGTACHTRWTLADRILIQDLILDKFIPEKRAKLQH